MSYSFDQQTALITGAGSGIGFAIAQHLARAGASVVLNDIEAGLAEAAAARIRDEGGQCSALPGDAGDVDFIYRMVNHAINTYGQLDLAIANAGLTLFGDFFSYKREDFQKVITLNLQGAFFLAQASARHMRERGQGGKILLMSSVLSRQPYPELAPYCMTKAALNMLAQTLVLELPGGGGYGDPKTRPRTRRLSLPRIVQKSKARGAAAGLGIIGSAGGGRRGSEARGVKSWFKSSQ